MRSHYHLSGFLVEGLLIFRLLNMCVLLVFCVTSDDQLVNSDQSDVTRQPLRSSKRLSDHNKSENQRPTAPTSPVGCHDVMKHRWQCKQCDKHFNLKRDLLLHVRSIHKTVTNQSAELVFAGKHLAVQQRGESALH